MRTFKGKMPERNVMESAMRAMAEGEDYSEHRELDALCRRLSRNEVEHEHSDMGPFHGIRFDSPHGRVSVMFGPGTIGSSKGLLEAFCDGWDMSPRGNLTAIELYDTYMHGGWE